MKRPRIGAELVQCAGDVYSLPWQEVRKVVVIETPKRRSDTITGWVYRQRKSTGQWDEYIGEMAVPKDTLQGPWAEYEAWLEAQA